MITVRLFHRDGTIEPAKIQGDDDDARRAARALIWSHVHDPDSDVYRGVTVDPFSQRFTFDSDSTWYVPRNLFEAAGAAA